MVALTHPTGAGKDWPRIPQVPLKPRKPVPGGRYHQPGRRNPPPITATGQRRVSVPQNKPVKRPLPPELLRRIDIDPLFQIMTGDQQWIDPFSGQALPATQGRQEVARQHLVESGSWRDREAMPRTQLDIIRWRIDLMRLLPVEPRLRIFGRDGRWLNPFNGEMVGDIVREDGKITAHTITAMAGVLCHCSEAMEWSAAR